jgi:hypothetical protein
MKMLRFIARALAGTAAVLLCPLGIWRASLISTKLSKSHLGFSARWIHDFDVSKRVGRRRL